MQKQLIKFTIYISRGIQAANIPSEQKIKMQNSPTIENDERSNEVTEETFQPEAKRPKACDGDNASSEEKPKNPGVTPPNPLSKNYQKKLKKMEEYAKNKKERRLKERERAKQRRQEAKEKGIPRSGPTRKELKKRLEASADDTETLQVAIDLDYDDLMSEHDIAKCIKQCLRIYTINRRSLRPAKLHLTGIKSDGRIHASLKKNDGWENWHVKYHFDRPHTEVFDTAELVYLTCESDNVLDRLKPETIYVIGGLVDHNHHKGLCHERATQAGLPTARLPLSEHVDMKTRSVLSTYHVFEILARINEGKSWQEAILETLPVRKGAKAKDKSVVEDTSPADESSESTKGEI